MFLKVHYECDFRKQRMAGSPAASNSFLSKFVVVFLGPQLAFVLLRHIIGGIQRCDPRRKGTMERLQSFQEPGVLPGPVVPVRWVGVGQRQVHTAGFLVGHLAPVKLCAHLVLDLLPGFLQQVKVWLGV